MVLATGRIVEEEGRFRSVFVPLRSGFWPLRSGHRGSWGGLSETTSVTSLGDDHVLDKECESSPREFLKARADKVSAGAARRQISLASR